MSGSTVTTTRPAPSRPATSRAAHTLAPAETPTSSPSSRASRSAVVIASSSRTWTSSSTTARLKTPGTNEAPIPWMPWTPNFPPASTGEFAGSTATIRTPLTFSRSTSPTPVIVPPVPTPATKASSWPPVASRISSAVVRRWTSGLAGFWNCCGMT